MCPFGIVATPLTSFRPDAVRTARGSCADSGGQTKRAGGVREIAITHSVPSAAHMIMLQLDLFVSPPLYIQMNNTLEMCV